ncbi:MAG: heme o synthase [Sciscionella sp.]
MSAVTEAPVDPPSGGRTAVEVVRAYVALTKPRIIEQLLVTTIPAMLLAARGIPSPWLVIATLIGGTLAAGSAGALNCVVDADIDAVMKRTRARPLVRHSVPKRSALIFGLVLGAVSFGVLYVTTNLLAAVMAVASIAFYVLVYTMLLKRRTSQNVVWGGICGCMPVVIGWAAVTDSVGWPAFVMFAVIFFWTPPHSWALAMKYREDYVAAGVPMLPAVKSSAEVSVRIVIYSWAMVVCTLLLIPATSWLYAVVAAVLGAWFLIAVHRMHAAVRSGARYNPMKVFHLSNSYLCGVFVVLAVDAVIGWPVVGWHVF